MREGKALTVLQFNTPPMPHYICSGFSIAAPGRKHPDRYAIDEFDLLVVMKGCQYIGEADRHFEVSEGHALILRPDLNHYSTGGCREETSSFWLHFQTKGAWNLLEDKRDSTLEEQNVYYTAGGFARQQVQINIPQFTRLLQPLKMYELLQFIVKLEQSSPDHLVRLRQQAAFMEILALLGSSMEMKAEKAGAEIASRAASYIRSNYRDHLTAEKLEEALNFHSVYIARCMQRQFGCSPMAYLNRYRVEQAKLLLFQTDLPINHIALETGFQQASYFASCFRKHEGITPRQYRQRFFSKH
jgi:AraC-like DNA-binding protein